MTGTPAVIVLTQGGLALARRIKAALPECEILGLASRVTGAEREITKVPAELHALFHAGRPIIGICAAGILIRAVAPLVRDKSAEPPVLAVAEDGSAVVPLLGGHRGANRLAEALAKHLGATAAITTAGDRRFGVALDDPPSGWCLANPENLKAFSAALLAWAGLRLEGEAPWLTESDLPFQDGGELLVTVTERAVAGSDQRLVYHPAVLALGVGCERGVSAAEVGELVRARLAEEGLAAAAVAGVFSVDVKADESALASLADDLGVPFRVFDPDRLEAERSRLANPSDLVFREVGCHGVAEGAALAAAGPDGQLIAPKTKSARATCAIALAPTPLDPQSIGRGRGRLAVVGIGPGAADWRTPEADAAIRSATDLVGYGLYLDLLGPLAEGNRRHGYALGEEQARVRAALDLAAEGRAVALVCSGDPGIYAMAALVFEELERADRDDWARVAVSVVPGLSALQAAAARIGAPLGHDFCAISLSDLLTPAVVIENRLRAAAAGDFVVALYNPVSQRRRQLLTRAREILLRHRPGDTPVVLARSLGRDGEAISVIRLDELESGQADMLTVVLIGSSETRRVARSDGGCWVYTPRGYAVKDTESAQPKSGEDAA